MKKLLFALIFIIALALPNKAVSAETHYAFFEICGFTFGCPDEWSVIDESDDQIMFKLSEDDESYVAIKVIPADYDGQLDDYFADYAVNEAETHLDYSYRLKIHYDELVLFQTYTEDGSYFAHNITELDDYFIHAICMSDHKISLTLQAQMDAIIVPLETPSGKN